MSDKPNETLYGSMMGPGTWVPMTVDNTSVRRDLPIGTYSVQIHPSGQMFLKVEPDMTMPPKIYGKGVGYAARIIRMFENNTSKNTGVMLVGEKGAGKTLLAKKISSILREKGMPTYIINNALHGPGFNAFLSAIPRGLVLFDEMEKVYDKEEQESLLTTFDGTVQTNHLMIVAANNKWGLDRNFENRPGRLHYWIEYKGIDSSAIEEYCQDALNQKEYISQIVSIASYLGMFTFDMLVALVKECNIHNISPVEAMEILNIREDSWSKASYSHTIRCDGLDITRYVAMSATGRDGQCVNITSSHPGSFTSLDLNLRVYDVVTDRAKGERRKEEKMAAPEKKMLEILDGQSEFDLEISSGPTSIDTKNETITFATIRGGHKYEVTFKKQKKDERASFFTAGAGVF